MLEVIPGGVLESEMSLFVTFCHRFSRVRGDSGGRATTATRGDGQAPTHKNRRPVHNRFRLRHGQSETNFTFMN
jgi:hypothetical protein